MVSDIDNIDLGSISSQPLLSMNASGESDPDIYSECKTGVCVCTWNTQMEVFLLLFLLC